MLGLFKRKTAEPVAPVPEYLGLSFAEIFTHPVVVSVFCGMLTVYLVLRRVFGRPGSWFSSKPAMAAHGFVFCVPFVYLASHGIKLWCTDPAVATMDRMFGFHPGAERMVAVMVGTQLYDIPSSLLIGGELASPNFVAHHITVLMLGLFAMHYRFVYYYGIYFMGVIELSTPLLAFVDLFRDFPKFAQAFTVTNEVIRILFAVAFFAVRIVFWIPASVPFWRDSLDLLFASDPLRLNSMPKALLVFWLAVHTGLTLLQWHWGIMILKAVYAMIKGDTSVRENEAKGA